MASLSSISSFTNEDTFGTFQAVAAVSGSLEETSLVCRFCGSCFMNERRHFKHFAGICGIFGFVEGGLSVFHFSCPCIIHERRHFRDFPGSCSCFGFVGGNVSGLPFQLSVLHEHERTKTKTALSRQLWQLRVRWRKRTKSSFSVVRAS